MKKRIISLAVAAAVFLSLVPPFETEAADDHANTLGSAATFISIGSTLSGTISPSSDVDWFRFTLPIPGRVTLTSTVSGGLDNYGYLYNSAQSLIASNDDTNGRAFGMTATLSAGAYYVKVASYNSASSGSYTVRLTATAVTAAPSPVTYYTVSYNANGGSGAPGSQTKTQNVALTLSGTRPTRSGYTFLGWATSSTATSASYQPGGSYTANANATLYAVWRVSTVTITWNANGGTSSVSASSKTPGTAFGTLPTATRSGYSFAGWFTAASGGTQITTSSAVPAANTTYYARWTTTAYTVSYNANGGSGAPGSQTKTQNAALTLSGTRPTRSGYTFLGWA
ncbi:MAG: InlB B-repeat-containing protein, partial [Oscillospiraceae bacterium]|nr:InlB B-repeat-containing protein [Oscillospiraceae bacterium]